MDDGVLTAVLQPGQAEWAGWPARRATLDAIRAALRGGVHSVNLCTLDGLARELFTYEGSGTLFTREDYCRIERLGIDDFEEVERLIERGQREGYLKPRTPAEMARILLNGFGAEIGSHHLAGVCGLRDRGASRASASARSSASTRSPASRVRASAAGCWRARSRRRARLGLRYVFACTIDERARGVLRAPGIPARRRTSDVPAAKWIGYERQRRARLRVLRHDLASSRCSRAAARTHRLARSLGHRPRRAGSASQSPSRLNAAPISARRQMLMRAQSGQRDVRPAVLHRHVAAGLPRRRRRGRRPAGAQRRDPDAGSAAWRTRAGATR